MKKKCIFLLEDNDDLRELFTYLLEEDDYEVKTYADATSFRKGIQTETPHPNVILMDIRLPDGNGLDICKELKSNPELAYIPIIMMSAHMSKSQVKETCPADDFIEKPFDITTFLHSVQQLA
jgi:two-component system phosphate regulon response regulator PhoB